MAYTVQQLADLSGVTVRTLHHYDAIGLLPPAYCGDNNYRYYEEEQREGQQWWSTDSDSGNGGKRQRRPEIVPFNSGVEDFQYDLTGLNNDNNNDICR